MRPTAMRGLLTPACLVALLIAAVAWAAESPVGKWKTVDEKTGKVVGFLHRTQTRLKDS